MKKTVGVMVGGLLLSLLVGCGANEPANKTIANRSFELVTDSTGKDAVLVEFQEDGTTNYPFFLRAIYRSEDDLDTSDFKATVDMYADDKFVCRGEVNGGSSARIWKLGVGNDYQNLLGSDFIGVYPLFEKDFANPHYSKFELNGDDDAIRNAEFCENQRVLPEISLKEVETPDGFVLTEVEIIHHDSYHFCSGSRKFTDSGYVMINLTYSEVEEKQPFFLSQRQVEIDPRYVLSDEFYAMPRQSHDGQTYLYAILSVRCHQPLMESGYIDVKISDQRVRRLYVTPDDFSFNGGGAGNGYFVLGMLPMDNAMEDSLSLDSNIPGFESKSVDISSVDGYGKWLRLNAEVY